MSLAASDALSQILIEKMHLLQSVRAQAFESECVGRSVVAARRALPKLRIVNLVATADLGAPIDLPTLGHASGFLYDRDVYHCAYLRDGKTRGKVMIFATGKMIAVGTNDLAAASKDLRYAAERVLSLGLVARASVSVEIQNIVATADLGHSMKLENLPRQLSQVTYEPEEWPGAIWHPPGAEGITIMVFASGKIVCTGMKRLDRLASVQLVLEELVDLA